jgi:NADPH2:quinone reductase
VHGASGAVGTAAVQLAASHGMTVIGTAGSDRGRELVKAQGAAHVLDHTTAGYLDALAELCGGKGPNVILEMLADVNLANDMEVAGHGGRIVVIGNRGAIEINARVAMMKDLDIRGMALPNTPDESMAEIHAALGKGLAAGDLKPVIGVEMPLAEASAAHVKVLEPGAYGKIVLLP